MPRFEETFCILQRYVLLFNWTTLVGYSKLIRFSQFSKVAVMIPRGSLVPTILGSRTVNKLLMLIESIRWICGGFYFREIKEIEIRFCLIKTGFLVLRKRPGLIWKSYLTLCKSWIRVDKFLKWMKWLINNVFISSQEGGLRELALLLH